MTPPTLPSSLALEPEEAAVLRKRRNPIFFFPTFSFGNNDLQPENHGERESTHIYHSHFHKPRAGCRHLLPPPGSEALPNCTSLQASRFRACSPLPPCRQPRDATPLRKETCLAQKVGFHLVRQGTVFGFLAQAAEKKATPWSESVIHTGQPKQLPALILFPSLLNILEKGVPNPSPPRPLASLS